MPVKKKIGDVLKEAGLIDDFQLESALAQQRNWGGKLGAILVELGYVQEIPLAQALADNLHLPYVNLFEPELPEEITGLIKPEVAKKYQVIPVRKEGKSLVLAMADPLDLEVMDAVRFITGTSIKPALATGSEIEDAIRKYYDHDSVTHAPQTVAPAKRPLPDEMELIPGSDLTMRVPEPGGAASSPASGEDAARQMPADAVLRLDALIGVLIEKGLVTREDLVHWVFQKERERQK